MLYRMAAWAVLETDARFETAAFERWMNAEQRRISLLCLRLLQNREEADNLAQEAFLRAYESMRGGFQPDDPGKWVTRIAVNLCLDHLRSRRWQFWKRTRAGGGTTIAVDGAPGPEALVRAREIGARIAAALARLSDRQRSVFVLRHYEDRSLEEIGEILDVDVGTVKSHLSRGVARMRQELMDLYGK
jgi:RNA polymerase sigma-70 factor (ECF subfamily)